MYKDKAMPVNKHIGYTMLTGNYIPSSLQALYVYLIWSNKLYLKAKETKALPFVSGLKRLY